MVDQETLHDAYARAGFILYPSAFPGEAVCLQTLSTFLRYGTYTKQAVWVALFFQPYLGGVGILRGCERCYDVALSVKTRLANRLKVSPGLAQRGVDHME